MCQGILGTHSCLHYSALRYTSLCIPNHPCALPSGRTQYVSHQCPLCDHYDQVLLQHSLALPAALRGIAMSAAQDVDEAQAQFSRDKDGIHDLWFDGKIDKHGRDERMRALQAGLETTKENIRAWVEKEEERCEVSWAAERTRLLQEWERRAEAVKVEAARDEHFVACVSGMRNRDSTDVEEETETALW